MLSKDDILSAEDRETVEVNVPEWGGTVNIRMMSAHERDEFESSMFDSKTMSMRDNFRATLVAYCLADENGDLIFGKNGAAELGKKSASAINRLFQVAQTLNRISDIAIEEEKGN